MAAMNHALPGPRCGPPTAEMAGPTEVRVRVALSLPLATTTRAWGLGKFHNPGLAPLLAHWTCALASPPSFRINNIPFGPQWQHNIFFPKKWPIDGCSQVCSEITSRGGNAARMQATFGLARFGHRRFHAVQYLVPSSTPVSLAAQVLLSQHSRL